MQKLLDLFRKVKELNLIFNVEGKFRIQNLLQSSKKRNLCEK